MYKTQSNKKVKKTKELSIEKKTLTKKIFDFLKSAIAIFLIIVGLLNVPQTCNYIKETFLTSTRDKFIKEKYVKGILIPPSLKDSSITVYFSTNGREFKTKDFLNGVNIDLTYFIQGWGKISSIYLKLINGRIYIFSEFKDFMTSEVVGVIEYNKWRILKDNVMDWKQSDNKFEVLDKRNCVIFSLQFCKPNIIKIMGYTMGDKNIAIIDDKKFSIIPYTNKNQAFLDIQNIPKIFDYSN